MDTNNDILLEITKQYEKIIHDIVCSEKNMEEMEQKYKEMEKKYKENKSMPMKMLLDERLRNGINTEKTKELLDGINTADNLDNLIDIIHIKAPIHS